MTPPKKLLLIVSGLLTALVVVIVIGIRTARPSSDRFTTTAPSCRLTFLDVGQGDAILIQTSDHQDVLIDGGPSAQVSRDLGKYFGFGNNEIELAILTHPDADHLAGFLAVVEDWPVETILTTGVVAETQLFKRWQMVAEETDATIISVQSGQTFQLGEQLQIDVLWPEQSWDGILYTAKAVNGRGGINDTSVGTKITCAGSTMLTTGDASDEVELALRATSTDLHVDLLKIGHHGSKYSSAHDFLRTVDPDIAVVQVGQKNRYGHPHPTVLERLKAHGIPIYRTDLQQTLQFQSTPGGWRLGG